MDGIVNYEASSEWYISNMTPLVVDVPDLIPIIGFVVLAGGFFIFTRLLARERAWLESL